MQHNIKKMVQKIWDIDQWNSCQAKVRNALWCLEILSTRTLGTQSLKTYKIRKKFSEEGAV